MVPTPGILDCRISSAWARSTRPCITKFRAPAPGSASRARAGLDGRGDLVGLPLADQVPDRGRRDHDLERRHAARLVLGRQQRLRHDALQDLGQLHAHLLLLGGREHVDDAVDGLRGVLVCRVAKTRWPVSAAVRARLIVSRSRISPTRMTSGSSRSAARRADGERLACASRSRAGSRGSSWTCARTRSGPRG